MLCNWDACQSISSCIYSSVVIYSRDLLSISFDVYDTYEISYVLAFNNLFHTLALYQLMFIVPLDFHVHILTQYRGRHFSRISNRLYSMSFIAGKTGCGQWNITQYRAFYTLLYMNVFKCHISFVL